MSNVGFEGRSFDPMAADDLVRLAEIARSDREQFFAEYPAWAELYEQQLLAVALCQGAALHYLDGTTGIQDFDLWTFYRKHPAKGWYPRRIKSYDFGSPKFGQSPDCPDYIGRRVDCIGRSIPAQANQDPAMAIQRYLQEGLTESARLLARKAVILLEPGLGQIIWPVAHEQRRCGIAQL